MSAVTTECITAACSNIHIGIIQKRIRPVAFSVYYIEQNCMFLITTKMKKTEISSKKTKQKPTNKHSNKKQYTGTVELGQNYSGALKT